MRTLVSSASNLWSRLAESTFDNVRQTAASRTVAIELLDGIGLSESHELFGLGFGFFQRWKRFPTNVIVKHEDAAS
jgi:hypothetical protein